MDSPSLCRNKYVFGAEIFKIKKKKIYKFLIRF